MIIKRHSLIYIATTFLLFFASPNTQAASLKINEVFPNPEGKDNHKEWLEIKNNSKNSINLQDWKIQVNSKIYQLHPSTISPNQLKILNSKNSKIKLPNNNVTISILDSQNQKVDQIYYTKAPSGKSLMTNLNQWTTPTPGKPNPQMQKVIGNFQKITTPHSTLIKKDDQQPIAIKTNHEQAEFLNLITTTSQDLSVTYISTTNHNQIQSIDSSPKAITKNTKNITTWLQAFALALTLFLAYLFKARPSLPSHYKGLWQSQNESKCNQD